MKNISRESGTMEILQSIKKKNPVAVLPSAILAQNTLGLF